MNKYFISYSFVPKNGAIGYGCNVVELKCQIESMEHINAIISALENDEFKNVVIINIQKMPI